MIGFLLNLVYTGFRGRIRYQIFTIQNGGFKKAATKMKNRNNICKNIYSDVFGVADYESVTDFRNSKWRFQDGSHWNEKSRYYS